MTKIPIAFDYQGKHYSGTLEQVAGAGTDVYHLMIDKFYYGRLRKANGAWVFDPANGSQMKELAGFFGARVEGLHKS
jgi:hypothetical protein